MKTMLAVIWESLWKQDLNSSVGTESRTQVEDFILLIASQMVSSDFISKDDVIDGGPWAGRCSYLQCWV